MNRLDPDRLDYHSYLLRLWRDGAQGVWHASLHSTAIEQVYRFASLEALVGFLDARLAAVGDDASRQMGADE